MENSKELSNDIGKMTSFVNVISMKTDVRSFFVAAFIGCLLCISGRAQAQIVQLAPAHLWQLVEFSVTNVPATANPFDPDRISLDAKFILPSGRTMGVPGFWYQNYQRGNSGGSEYLTPSGAPAWRIRFAPPESGDYSISLTIKTNQQSYGAPIVANFTVPTNTPPTQAGYVQVAANRQYFQTGDGQALRLIGENVDWPTTGQGTHQYDSWFTAMQAVGENYARIMMTPWAFGIETDTNTLTNYRLDNAWKLDYVMQLTEQRGLYVLLCLDIHLMWQPVPDYWGADNYWQSNPYNSTNGGPCINQDAFFTNSVAQGIYQKRLRYMVARYGYSPRLLGWQLLSEIDNEYAYLNPANIPPWHKLMAGWLHTNDVFGHLVTTSLTGGSDRPEIWNLPELDFATYHSYAEPPPASRLNRVAQSFVQRYTKPVLIDEFGTDWRGWNRTSDPYLRGFRQGIWGGALGGSAGTAMSWWWDSIDSDNAYPVYGALGAILKRTGWGRDTWTNITFKAAGSPPDTVGTPIPGGAPFTITLVPGGTWGDIPSGRLAVADAGANAYAAATLNSFLLGSWFPSLVRPFVLCAWLTNSAKIVMHINSVSESAGLAVLVDGAQLFSTNLPNLDGQNLVNNEYNLDLPVNLPAGNHFIALTNNSLGWVYLDWVRLEQVLPANYSGNWAPAPEAIGLGGPHESLVYVVAPEVSFPGNAMTATLPVCHGTTLTLSNWPAGDFAGEWYSPATGASLGLTRGTATNGNLMLGLPDYTEDVAGLVYAPSRLDASGFSASNGFQIRFNSETGGRYEIQSSIDLSSWNSFAILTNTTGSMLIAAPFDGASRAFFRARRLP